MASPIVRSRVTSKSAFRLPPASSTISPSLGSPAPGRCGKRPGVPSLRSQISKLATQNEPASVEKHAKDYGTCTSFLSCCSPLYDLCHPAKCIIDQNEVEVIPGTARTNLSSSRTSNAPLSTSRTNATSQHSAVLGPAITKQSLFLPIRARKDQCVDSRRAAPGTGLASSSPLSGSTAGLEGQRRQQTVLHQQAPLSSLVSERSSGGGCSDASLNNAFTTPSFKGVADDGSTREPTICTLKTKNENTQSPVNDRCTPLMLPILPGQNRALLLSPEERMHFESSSTLVPFHTCATNSDATSSKRCGEVHQKSLRRRKSWFCRAPLGVLDCKPTMSRRYSTSSSLSQISFFDVAETSAPKYISETVVVGVPRDKRGGSTISVFNFSQDLNKRGSTPLLYASAAYVLTPSTASSEICSSPVTSQSPVFTGNTASLPETASSFISSRMHLFECPVRDRCPCPPAVSPKVRMNDRSLIFHSPSTYSACLLPTPSHPLPRPPIPPGIFWKRQPEQPISPHF